MTAKPLTSTDIRKRLALLRTEPTLNERMGKFQTSEYTCILVTKIAGFAVEWEAINNGVGVGRYVTPLPEFVARMVATQAREHWTIGA